MSERLGHGHTCHSVNINMRLFHVYHFLHRKNQTHFNYSVEVGTGFSNSCTSAVCTHGNEVDLRCWRLQWDCGSSFGFSVWASVNNWFVMNSCTLVLRWRRSCSVDWEELNTPHLQVISQWGNHLHESVIKYCLLSGLQEFTSSLRNLYNKLNRD